MSEVPLRCTRCNEGTSFLHYDPQSEFMEVALHHYYAKSFCPRCKCETTFTPRFS